MYEITLKKNDGIFLLHADNKVLVRGIYLFYSKGMLIAEINKDSILIITTIEEPEVDAPCY